MQKLFTREQWDMIEKEAKYRVISIDESSNKEIFLNKTEFEDKLPEASGVSDILGRSESGMEAPMRNAVSASNLGIGRYQASVESQINTEEAASGPAFTRTQVVTKSIDNGSMSLYDELQYTSANANEYTTN